MAPFQARAHTREKLLGVESKSSRVSETERKETEGPDKSGEGEESQKISESQLPSFGTLRRNKRGESTVKGEKLSEQNLLQKCRKTNFT